jgi:5'-nucleotidase (lipoprotein e(P4) family)
MKTKKMIPFYFKAIILLLLLSSKQSFGQQQTQETNIKILPVLWQQTSAEYRALCYQAFNLASLRLKEIPNQQIKKRNLAIITDLDETILDNSGFEAHLIKEKIQISDREWKLWTDQSRALAVPGAVSFLQEASKMGITIFYVSNRDTSAVKSTILNLQKLKLPNADAQHCLFKKESSSKEERRLAVEKNYNLIMLLGDNLNDFTAAFEKKNIPQRLTETDKEQNQWGKKFIVLPNPVYGEWENALYNYVQNKTEPEREQNRLNLLAE